MNCQPTCGEISGRPEMEPFTILRPHDGRELLLIINVHHTGTRIPDEVMGELAISLDDLRDDLDYMPRHLIWHTGWKKPTLTF